MWTENLPLEEMRAAVRALLPCGAMLKRDRGDALLVTDARIACLPGFTWETRGSLTALYPDGSWLLRFERRFPAPPDDLSASMLRFKGVQPDHGAILLFIRGAKLTDTSANTEKERFDIAVRKYAAAALREKSPGGGRYALALLDSLLKT